MPLPLLLIGGAIVLTGGTGVAGGATGLNRFRRAKRLNTETLAHVRDRADPL